MTFAQPWLLGLAVLVPLAHVFWKRRARPPVLSYSLRLPKTARMRNPTHFLLVLRYLAFAALAFAAARPQTSYTTVQRSVRGVDIMMVMDISASMNIEDLGLESRLEIAKQMMKDFVRGRSNDRVGFSVFSGEGVTLGPPTLDYGIVLQGISDVRPGELKDGTAIGDGLAVAVARLKKSDAKSRVIVLLTDGDNNIGQVDPMTAGELAAGFGLRVYTIAIGKEGRVRMPIRAQNIFGQPTTSYQWFENALNPELLTKIAAMTGGKFYRVTDEATLANVFKEIDSLERSEVKAKESVRYVEHFQAPLVIALVLLLLEQLLATFIWRFAL
jgi:Ca-activated chloride channel family protein